MPKENIQQTLKELYARAKRHEIFTDLISIVLNRENILLAYRNIKSNSGSNTPDTDGLTIKDIERFTAEEVIAKVRLEVSGRKEIRRMLKAPIKFPNGELIFPRKGTPQGGIISPLLANIVLNELDHWVKSNWEENPAI